MSFLRNGLYLLIIILGGKEVPTKQSKSCNVL